MKLSVLFWRCLKQQGDWALISEYILILLWIGLVALVGKGAQFKRTVLIEGVEEQRYLWIFAFVAFFPIIWMAGHRGFFSDTSAYITGYLDTTATLSDIGSIISGAAKDKGYAVLVAACDIPLFKGAQRGRNEAVGIRTDRPEAAG